MIYFNPLVDSLWSSAAQTIELRVGQTLKAKVIDNLSNDKILVRMGGVSMELRSEMTLEKEAILLLRVIDAPKGGTIRLQLLQSLRPHIDFSFLDSLDIFNTDAKTLLALVNFDERLKKRVIEDFLAKEHEYLLNHKIQRLIDILDPKIAQMLQTLMIQPQELDAKKIKDAIEKKEHSIVDAFLAVAAHIPDKKSRQEIMDIVQLIQNYWLLGAMSGSLIGYLPLDWEGLEESRIIIKKLNYKRIYLCKIHLKFHDTGHIDATLILHKHFLNVVLAIEDEGYRKAIHDSHRKLKVDLAKNGLMVHVLIKPYKFEDIAPFLSEESFMKAKA